MGFKKEGIDIDDEATYEQAQSGDLVVDNCIFYNNSPNYSDSSDDTDFTPPFTVENFMKTTMSNNLEAAPKLGAPYNLADPDFRPAADSPAVDGTVPVATPPSGTNIVATDYIGAIDPDNDWTRKPWTSYGERAGETTTTTTASVTTTTAPVVSTTTTAVSGICASEAIYGEYSEETELLRYLRDNVLSETPEGQEIIRLYYIWSPVVVRMMEEDEEFKSEVKTLLDGVLLLNK
jgi:hypothetical protein